MPRIIKVYLAFISNRVTGCFWPPSRLRIQSMRLEVELQQLPSSRRHKVAVAVVRNFLYKASFNILPLYHRTHIVVTRLCRDTWMRGIVSPITQETENGVTAWLPSPASTRSYANISQESGPREPTVFQGLGGSLVMLGCMCLGSKLFHKLLSSSSQIPLLAVSETGELPCHPIYIAEYRCVTSYDEGRNHKLVSQWSSVTYYVHR